MYYFAICTFLIINIDDINDISVLNMRYLLCILLINYKFLKNIYLHIV